MFGFIVVFVLFSGSAGGRASIFHLTLLSPHFLPPCCCLIRLIWAPSSVLRQSNVSFLFFVPYPSFVWCCHLLLPTAHFCLASALPDRPFLSRFTPLPFSFCTRNNPVLSGTIPIKHSFSFLASRGFMCGRRSAPHCPAHLEPPALSEYPRCTEVEATRRATVRGSPLSCSHTKSPFMRELPSNLSNFSVYPPLSLCATTVSHDIHIYIYIFIALLAVA